MQTTIDSVQKAAQALGISVKKIGDNDVFIELSNGKKVLHMIANNTGLNSEIVKQICLDKAYTYVLLKDLVNQPKTVVYIDPNPPELYKQFASILSYEQIAEAIKSTFSFPLIIKPNSGSQGEHVFKCKSDTELTQAISTVYDKKSLLYDHVLIAQPSISIQREFRVVVYKQDTQFVYEKDISTAEYQGNISPLHWSNSHSVLISDQALLDRIQSFILPIFTKIPLEYAGLDVVIDQQDKMWLLEINTQPGFTYFVSDNGDTQVVKLFERVLKDQFSVE